MRKQLKAVLFLATGLLLVVNALAGVAGAGTVTVSFDVQPTLILTLSTPTVGLGELTPGTTSFGESLTTTVRSNTGWNLTASAPASFSTAGTTPSHIPIGRLRTRTGGGEWKAFAEDTVSLLAGQPKGGNNVNSWDYELTIAWEDNPGAYSAGITYTATGS